MRKWLLFFLLLPCWNFASENSFIPCRHSDEMMELVLECLEKAEQSIELSLCFTGGKVFHDIFEKVEERMQEIPELQVYALSSPVLLVDEDKDLIATLLAKYPKQFHYEFTPQPFTPLPEVVTMDNHIKTIIVDEKYFSLGGTNFDEAFVCEGIAPREHVKPAGLARDQLPNGNRDQDIIGRGELATDLRKIFFKQFALWRHYESHHDDFIVDPEYFSDKCAYRPLDPSKKRAEVPRFDHSPQRVEVQKAYLVMSGPMDYPNKVTVEYEKLIKAAKVEIQIGNLYISPPPPILNALITKIRSGIAFRLVSNGLFEHSPGFHAAFVWANRVNYSPLFYGKEYNFWELQMASRDRVLNSRIYEYKVEGIMYHKKVMVVDRNIAVIGSYNLGLRSATTDYEAILVIESPKIAETFIDILAEDQKYSEEILPVQARDWYFDPVIRYLAAFQKQFHGFF